MNGPYSIKPQKQPRPFRKTSIALLALGTVVSLVAVVYTVENWRGRRAWERCRRELEAKGDVLDWSAYIPEPVPDEQNVFKAPNMTAWFVKSGGFGQQSQGWRASRHSLRDVHDERFSGPLAFVFVSAGLSPVDTNAADLILQSGDPAAAEKVRKVLEEHMGAALVGVRGDILVKSADEKTKPAQIIVRAATCPDVKAMTSFLLGRLGNSHDFFVAASGTNQFRILLKGSVYTAADFLAGTDELSGEFNAMRRALDRPVERLAGKYDPPIDRPYLDFVAMRSVAQCLGTRAQAHLLLGQSDEAWRELTLVHDLCRLLETKPASLVSAMINVAITGLYVEVVRQGLALNAWNNSQLLALEKQLDQVNLVASVNTAFKVERAATCRTLDVTPPRELARLFSANRGSSNWYDTVTDLRFWLLTLAPRGWVHQNEATAAWLSWGLFEGLDATNRLVSPSKLTETMGAIESRRQHPSPRSVLATEILPNYLKACVVLACTQALVNECQIACALERYRLANRQYPESLAALEPGFLDKVPPDSIVGQALKYQRTADGRFLLYSAGWDGKDDGGTISATQESGDWVWTFGAL